MSYTVSGSGHGADIEKTKAAFADFVAALDAATDLEARQEGWADPSLFQGSISGGDANGSFSLSASEVRARATSETPPAEVAPEAEA